MKGKVLQAILVIALIFTLVMADAVLICVNIAYAISEEKATSQKNVEFESYFKLESGEKVYSDKKASTETDLKLYLNVSVKQEGYLNGEVELIDSNFNLKPEVLSEYVNKIEGNKIYLNQINAGQSIEIPVGIELAVSDKIELGLLAMQSKVVLNGIYKDSTQKDINVTGTRTVELEVLNNSTQKENVKNELELITNKVMSIDGSKKTVVQLSLKMGLIDNGYPVKNIHSEIEVPTIDGSGPKVEVIVNRNSMTSYEADYNKTKANTITIDLNNEVKNNKISWKKEGYEEAIITFIYDYNKEIDMSAIFATSKEKITLYDQMEITPEDSTILLRSNENKDSIITVESKNSEDSIFKGRLYAGEQRPYTNTTTLNVNLANIQDEITINDIGPKFIGNNTEVIAEVNYASSVINKKQAMDILGTDGSLKILDSSRNGLIAEITNSTVADENGNITITYPENLRTIKIVTTGPVKTGKIEITNNKVIKPFEKTVMKNMTGLTTGVQGEYKLILEDEVQESPKVETKIELKESTTDAKIQINKTSLTTLADNENVQIIATLKSSSEENDLFKNPSIQIELPKELEDLKINSVNKMYADELTAVESKVITTSEGKKAIRLTFLGGQTGYTNDVSEGIQIVIDTNMKFNKLTPTKASEIVMNYTNQNGADTNYQAKVPVNLVSKYGVLLNSKVSGFNEEGTVLESFNDTVLNGKLDIQGAARTAISEKTLVNSYEKEITNVSLVGRIPENGSEQIDDTAVKSNFVASLAQSVQNSKGAKVYYSDESDISKNSDGWQENISDIASVRSYKVILDKVESGDSLGISFKLNIPQGLTYNKNMYEKVDVSYTYEGQTVETNSATYLSTVASGQSNEKEIEENTKKEEVKGIGEVWVVATSGGQVLKDGQAVFEGQSIQYTVKIKNESGKDLSNLKIDVNHKNVNLYGEEVFEEKRSTDMEETISFTYLVEKEGLTQETIDVGELKSGETKTIKYQAVVKENVTGTSGEVKVYADEVESKTIKTVTNKVVDGDLKLSIMNFIPEGYNLMNDKTVSISLQTKNISDKEQKNVIVEFELPEQLKVQSIEPNDNYTIIEQTNSYVKVKINEIAKGDSQEVMVWAKTDATGLTEDTAISFYYMATADNKTYVSNQMDKVVEKIYDQMEITLEGSIKEDVIQTGDELTYVITAKNPTQDKVKVLDIYDLVPEAAVVKSASYLRGNKDISTTSLVTEVAVTDNIVRTENIELNSGDYIKLSITTTIDEELASESKMTNQAVANTADGQITSNEVAYTLKNVYELEQEIEKEKQEAEKDDDDDDDDDDDIVVTRNISGYVWVDANKNGIKEADEEAISDMEISLINTETGKYVTNKSDEKITVTTNKNGRYVFEKIDKGSYIVMMEYDSTKYSTTEYKKSGVSEQVNSDVISKKVTIDGKEKTVAVSDALDVTNANAEYINAGLVENVIFDLRLDKMVSKITVQNTSGTNVTNYDNVKLAKVELDAKQVANTTVLIEYKIAVTNEGEIAGYVNEILDYMPTDLKFNSEINKQWYTSTDGNLHNMGLAKELINPGETKTVTLTLIKNMTENNTGLTSNIAEIGKSSNDLSIADIDSIVGNKAQNEDDLSTAEVIISVKTGTDVIVGVWAIIITLGAIGLGVYFMKRKEVDHE